MAVTPIFEFLWSQARLLRELLREGAGLCHALLSMHTDQLDRLTTLIKAQREHALELETSPLQRQLAQLYQSLTPLEARSSPTRSRALPAAHTPRAHSQLDLGSEGWRVRIRLVAGSSPMNPVNPCYGIL